MYTPPFAVVTLNSVSATNNALAESNAFASMIETIFAESICMSSAFAMIPLPPTTSSVRVEAIVPPPVKPAPAVIVTPV